MTGANTSIALYAPWRLDEKDFLAGFIAREELVTFLLHQLRTTATDGEPRHRLVLGQRGMGKTSLLRRLEIGIRRDPDLNIKLLPLTFREEQYNLRALDRFWRNCGEALAEWLEKSGDSAGADRLDRDMCDPAWQDADTAADAFLAEAAKTGRRPVLLLDNLDLVLDALPEEQHWQLRRILQATGGPIIYGAAIQPPRQTGDPRAAFYEFFQFNILEPLTKAELLQCLRRLATARGDAGHPVMAILAEHPERLQVLHRLTGGNPRILALLYQLLERAESDTVFADLEVLLDQMTPLYKARVEELKTEMQRSVLDAIALHWDPVTSRELAEATQIEVTTISSQLHKLKIVGLVEEVPTSGARAGYQLIERFFNVWYLMRHGTRRTRQKMRWLTEFLRYFYSLDDLQQMRDRFMRQPTSGRWGPLYADALDAAVFDVMDRQPRFVGPPEASIGGDGAAGAVPGRNKTREAAKQDIQSIEDGDASAEAEEAYREAIRLDPKDVKAWGNLGILLRRRDRLTEAEEAFREAIRLDPKDVKAWGNLGILLRQMDRRAEAEEAFREVIRLDPKDVRAWGNLGILLSDQPDRLAEAEEAFREAIRLDPKDAWAWGNLGILLSDQPDRLAEAEEAYREAIRRDPKALSAWGNLGILLRQMDRRAEAEEAFREVIRLDPKDVRAWGNLGNLLRRTDRLAEAEEAYREVIRLDPKDAWAWGNLGNLLSDQPGRHAEAEEAYCEAIRLDPKDPRLWGNLGNLLRQTDRLAEAEEAYRKAVRLDPKDAWAWGNLGNLFSDQPGRLAEAEEAYREVIRLDAEDAWAWGNLGNLLRRTDRLAEAEEAFREAIRLDPEDVSAWGNLGNLLRLMDRLAEAEEAYREVIRLDPEDVKAWGNLGILLSDQPSRLTEAEEAYREVIRLNGKGPWAKIGRSNLLWLYISTGRTNEARDLRQILSGMEPVGLRLIDAAIELLQDNFGAATECLGDALDLEMESDGISVFDDLLRLLRLFKRYGYGERLIAWFETTGQADRHAPIHAALKAYVRGESMLLDVNPEVRQPAERIHARLASHRPTSETLSAPKKRRRGRPPKRATRG